MRFHECNVGMGRICDPNLLLRHLTSSGRNFFKKLYVNRHGSSIVLSRGDTSTGTVAYIAIFNV